MIRSIINALVEDKLQNNNLYRKVAEQRHGVVHQTTPVTLKEVPETHFHEETLIVDRSQPEVPQGPPAPEPTVVRDEWVRTVDNGILLFAVVAAILAGTVLWNSLRPTVAAPPDDKQTLLRFLEEEGYAEPRAKE